MIEDNKKITNARKVMKIMNPNLKTKNIYSALIQTHFCKG